MVQRTDRSLRREDQKRVVAAQRRRIRPQARVVWARVRGERERAVRVAVHVTREAGDTFRRLLGDAVVRGVEPRRLKRRHQEAQAVELLGRDDPVEHVEVVPVRDLHAARDVAELGVRREVERRRELGEEAFRDVEADVEPLVLRMHARPREREDHVRGGLERVIERREGEEVAIAHRFGGHAPRALPRTRRRQEASPPGRSAASCRATL